MARQNINIGSSANDGTGDPLRTAFDKINDNFIELYGGDNDINTLDANLNTNNFAITTGVTNGDVTITPNGTGSIKLGAMKFVGTTMSSDDSTQITIAENIQTTGTINVDGAATIGGATTLSTSLALASGATVTAILDEDAMGTNSATALATQQSIKAYVDSQVTASDLDFQGDSGGALSVDLDSQTFTVTGGTGIDTSGSGQTLTVAVDSTVATLTGSQTLTNKVLTSPTINGATMTGNVTVDNLIFTDTDISTASNGDLTLNPGGTGTIQLHANTAVTGTASVSSTLTTADITTTGNTTVSGNSTVAGTLTVQGSINADTIVSNSNGDITIDPAGTGAIVLTGPITATGTQTTTGQLNVDNLRLDGNTLSATSGGITLTPATSQNVTVGGTLIASEANFTLMEATTVRTDTLSTDTSNADLTIGTQGTGNIVVDTGIIARTGDLELDVSGNLYLDADGGTMFLQDGTAGTFGQFIRAGSNDLTIASGSTQALIFTGANAAFQGDLSVTGGSTLDGVTITDNTIKSNASNADLQIGTSGTGVIDILTATQTTVGSAGGANALPGTPTGYIKVKIGGTMRVIPFYDES
jgi:hypothetical protein